MVVARQPIIAISMFFSVPLFSANRRTPIESPDYGLNDLPEP